MPDAGGSTPLDPWEEEWPDLPLDGEPETEHELAAQVPTDDEEPLVGFEFGQYDQALTTYHLEFLVLRRNQRKTLIVWALVASSAVMLISVAVMITYMVAQWDDLSPVVMTGWFTGVVAQVLGILFVISSFLFPKEDHGVEEMIRVARGQSPPGSVSG